jgi:D-alanyl-lipoteichoic acid acyltransferase DltB (MBOAT superfamily)
MEQWLQDIINYHEDKPLLFTQLYFWGFFALVLTVYSFIYKHKAWRNAFLFFASLFFYYKTSGFFFFILLLSTLIDFGIGHAIYASKVKLHKKLWVGASVVVNLFLLGYFKYAYFFADFMNDVFGVEVAVVNQFAYVTNQVLGTDFVWNRILLPVGISFFTFQTISYSVDIYRGLIKPVRSILDFGFYVSFFPQLVAGPIVRAADFIPQLYQKYALTKQQFGLAIFWILNGLLKKMFLADYIAINFIDRVFENPTMYSGFENMMALFGYSLQVYADFSGYTDIAIGVALLLGFTLPTNFNSPYKATSVSDFWRRWHISLSTWLRDYLYIPMGGNRSGSFFSYFMMFVVIFFVSLLAQSWYVPVAFAALVLVVFLTARISQAFKRWVDTNINLMLTMLLGGLWHGSSWNFVVWGGLNGLGLMVYKGWKKISPWADRNKWYNRTIGIAITLIFITFTRTWFRSPTWESANQMLTQIGSHFQPELIPEVIWGFRYPFLVMLIGYIIHWIPETGKSWYRNTFIESPLALKIIAGFITVFIIYQILSADLQPFIYFAF